MSKRRTLKKTTQMQVSLGGVCVESGLPLPIVYYPNHYGAFFAFSQNEGGAFFLCECGRVSLENLIELNRRYPQHPNTNPLRHADVDSFHVPDVVAKKSLDCGSYGLDAFSFRQGICHRCNLVPPSQRWCHEMYGGQFKQSFGWYIQQMYLRLGIRPISYEYLADRCPSEFRIQLDEIFSMSEQSLQQYETGLGVVTKEAQKLKRKLNNDVENIVRKEFGFRKVGEGWVSETLLYQAICRLFPNEHIIRHHRPDWLGGLELDIYIPKLNLGFEYQGQQHYRPISAWGGEAALYALKERDDKKRKICKTNDTVLIEIDFTEAITEQHIRSRLLEAGVLPVE